jgi:hypothetical protein
MIRIHLCSRMFNGRIAETFHGKSGTGKNFKTKYFKTKYFKTKYFKTKYFQMISKTFRRKTFRRKTFRRKLSDVLPDVSQTEGAKKVFNSNDSHNFNDDSHNRRRFHFPGLPQQQIFLLFNNCASCLSPQWL